MFNLKLKKEIRCLKEEKETLEIEVKSLNSRKKIDEEELKALIKLKEDKMGLDFKRKEMDLAKEHQQKQHNLQVRYNEKLQERLETEVENIKEMYGEVLKRLPDVNVRLKGDV